MRIIGGTHRSRIVKFPDFTGLRPTPDRVRETLFNWLGQDLSGLTCLDLFAGSGALGFEAASRGAALVVMIERDALTHQALSANSQLLELTGVELRRGDALEFLRFDTRRFDVVFVDPPFDQTDYAALIEKLGCHLAPGARVYVEAPRFIEPPNGWLVLRRLQAGHVHAHLLQHDDEASSLSGNV